MYFKVEKYSYEIGEMQIKDKRVIMTGAASGAGLAFSRELLRNGALVCNLIITFCTQYWYKYIVVITM